jgi:hypothetical protein
MSKPAAFFSSVENFVLVRVSSWLRFQPHLAHIYARAEAVRGEFGQAKTELLVKAPRMLRRADRQRQITVFLAGILNAKLGQLFAESGSEMIVVDHTPTEGHGRRVAVVQGNAAGTDNLAMGLDDVIIREMVPEKIV